MRATAHLEQDFWEYLDQLIAQSEIIIDRPRGSTHPEIHELVYPLDYGYLDQTHTADGGGIDLWLGSQPKRQLDSVALTVDLFKRDAEIKLLLGCTEDEKRIVLELMNSYQMRARLVRRGGELNWLRSRRSVRRFERRPVPESLLREVLETAIWAPSAHNRQPWRFVVLHSLSARKQLANAMGNDFRRDLLEDGLSIEEIETQVARSYDRITNAAAAVLLCFDANQGDQYPDPRRQQAEFLMGAQGTALAGAYLLLAAHAAGLASVWMCAPLFAPESVCQIFDLPRSWHPQALVLLGYPAGIPEARKRRPVEEVALFR